MEPVQPPPAKRQRRESSLVIYCHDDCARHETSDGGAEHQESPARLAAIAAALQNYARRRDFAPADREAPWRGDAPR